LAGAFVFRVINRDLTRVKEGQGYQTVTEIKSDGGEFSLSKSIKHAFNKNVNTFL